MTRSASLVALSTVGAALVVAWFWFGSHEVTPPSPPEAHIGTPDVPATETTVAVSSVTVVEDNVGAPQASPPATDDERAAGEAKKISDAFERGVTSTFVDYLVSKGASREDSERVVADGMREVASCVQNAVATQPPDGAAPVEVKFGLPPKVMYGLNLQGSTIEFTATVLPE